MAAVRSTAMRRALSLAGLILVSLTVGFVIGLATTEDSDCGLCAEAAGAYPAVEATSPTTTTSSIPSRAGPAVEGTWALTMETVSASPGCEHLGGTTSTIEVSQAGSTLLVTGVGDPGVAWEGRIDGRTISFGGSRSEGGGLTTARFSVELESDGRSFSGIQDWIWEGRDAAGNPVACADGRSIVGGERID